MSIADGQHAAIETGLRTEARALDDGFAQYDAHAGQSQE
jgi:hypothetical protein